MDMITILIMTGTLLTVFHGFLKAFTDRTLWGSNPNDDTHLWLDDWKWFQEWKKGKISLPGFKWVLVDAWHAADGIKVNVGKTAGMFDTLFIVFLYLDGFQPEWYWWILIFIGWQIWSFTVMATAKWLFYEILFWKKPIDGFKNWKTKVWG